MSDGRHPTGGVTSGKNASGGLANTHADSDVPAPGNTDLGKGGATSMSGSSQTHPGAQGAPAQGVAGSGGAGAGMAHSDVPQGQTSKQGSSNPEADPKDQKNTSSKDGEKKMTPEQANAAGDGTFGDGKFDASAPGAGAKATQLESKARTEAGEEGHIKVNVN